MEESEKRKEEAERQRRKAEIKRALDQSQALRAAVQRVAKHYRDLPRDK